MRVLVFGSRHFRGRELVGAALRALPPGAHIIVTGGCRGADLEGSEVAKELGLQREEWPARWHLYGKAAGPRRNQEMVDSGIDLAIGFDVRGKGSWDIMRRLEAANVKTKIVDSPQ